MSMDKNRIELKVVGSEGDRLKVCFRGISFSRGAFPAKELRLHFHTCGVFLSPEPFTSPVPQLHIKAQHLCGGLPKEWTLNHEYPIGITGADFDFLTSILEKYNELIQQPRPTLGEDYYCFTSQGEVIGGAWGQSEYELVLWEYGNVFRTREEAEDAAKEVKKVLTALRDNKVVRVQTGVKGKYGNVLWEV